MQLDGPVAEEVGELCQQLSRFFKEAATSKADGSVAVLWRATPALAVADCVQ